MARSRSNFGLVGLAATGTLVVAAAAGCTTIGGIAYLINPDDVPAESTALRGKHVAVVCRPVVELEYSDAGSSRELARLVGESLRENVRRCRVIGSAEVARWLDENDWVDYPTLGKAVDADIVATVLASTGDLMDRVADEATSPLDEFGRIKSEVDGAP